MDKSNHLVTVPRDYLEMLENEFEKNKNFNMNGHVRKVIYPPDSASPISYEVRTLFIQDKDLNVNNVIVVDNEGKEISKFRKIIQN